MSPLYLALLKQNVTAVEMLLTYGADVESGHGQFTPLMLAAQLKSKRSVDALLDSGANINTKTETQQTALYFAIDEADEQEDGSVRYLSGPLEGMEKIQFYYTEQVAIVDTLLSKGALPEDVQQRAVLLQLAANHTVGELTEVVALLLEAGVDPNVPKADLASVFHHAVVWKAYPLAELLVDHGADVHTKIRGWHPIQYAASNKDALGLLKSIIAANGRTDVRSPKGFLPIYTASYNGYTEHVQVLIAAGTKIDTQGGESRFTPLMTAADNERTDVVRELLAAGADPNLQSKGGNTALHFAVRNNNGSIVKMLLVAGADPNLRTHSRMMSPLHEAAFGGYYEVADWLMQAGANPNLKMAGGDTPTEIALDKGFKKTTAAMKKHGGSATSSDGDMLTKFFVTAAVAGVASMSDIPIENQLDVVSATAKDVWVEDGKGSNLAKLHQNALNGNTEIQDPVIRKLAESRYNIERQNAQIQAQIEQARQKQHQTQEGTTRTAMLGNSTNAASSNANTEGYADEVVIAKTSKLIPILKQAGQDVSQYEALLAAEKRKPRSPSAMSTQVKPNKVDGYAFCRDSNADTQIAMHCKTASLYYSVYLKALGTPDAERAYSHHEQAADVLYRLHQETAI